MTDDPQAQINALQAQLADAKRALAALQANAAPPPPAPPAQTATGEAKVGVMAGPIAGPVTVQQTNVAGNQYNVSGVLINDLLDLWSAASGTQRTDYDDALNRYLRHLMSHYGQLDLRGIHDSLVELPLTQIYLSLQLHEPHPDELRAAGGLRGFMQKTQMDTVDDTRPATALESRMVGGGATVVDWAQALRHPRLAVLGLPGSGKTTLLHYTTVCYAHVLLTNDQAKLAELGFDLATLGDLPLVPLFLPLRELGSVLKDTNRSAAAGSNAGLLLECLTNYYARSKLLLPPDFFHVLCDRGRAILLLDGLDEVVIQEDRAVVSAIVQNFTRRYATCRYVVTSRIAGYEGEVQLGPDYRRCTVADLDEAQQRLFITNWSTSILTHPELDAVALKAAATCYADALWQALTMNDRVRALATNPLLLTVVAVIYYNKRILPDDRAELYEACVEVLLRGGRGQIDRARQERMKSTGVPGLEMTLEAKRTLLGALAYDMHQGGEKGKVIDRTPLVQTLALLLEDYPKPLELAGAFVTEMPVHLGLLDEYQPDRFHFSHLSFQEFLAARHIAEDTDDRWGELLDHYDESWWREVILLCAGHLSQARCWRFLAQLLACGTTPLERANALALASDALLELERFKGQGPLRQQIQAEALRIVTADPLRTLTAKVVRLFTSTPPTPAAARVTAGRVLGQVGDPRAGVATLPLALVAFAGGSFRMGSSATEAAEIGQQAEADYRVHYQQWGYERMDEQIAINIRSNWEDTITTQPTHILPFALARYPVTNAQYALFMAAEGYTLAAPWWDAAGRAWLQRDDAATAGLEAWQRRARKDQPAWWDDKQVGRERTNHPVVGVNWYEATAFCRWLTAELQDGFTYCLPSEAEWEYAARGMKRRIYAWGNAPPDAERANYQQRYTGTSAVGSFPLGATPEGLWDMTGNVWEWTRSAYQPYPYDPQDGREDGRDPAQKRFTLRGGSWYDRPFGLRASNRDGDAPDFHFSGVGFRVSRYPQV